jgi:uncharacterized protein (TIGR00106 family)
MSTILEFAMFPTDKGAGVSQYVSQIIAHIRESGHAYQLTPMGTIVETASLRESLQLMQECYDILEPAAERIYCSAKFDIRKGNIGRIEQKIQSIEEKIGKVNK